MPTFCAAVTAEASCKIRNSSKMEKYFLLKWIPPVVALLIVIADSQSDLCFYLTLVGKLNIALARV
jgi:hypothetical protein